MALCPSPKSLGEATGSTLSSLRWGCSETFLCTSSRWSGEGSGREGSAAGASAAAGGDPAFSRVVNSGVVFSGD